VNEASKARKRYQRDGLVDKYFSSDKRIMDIGCGGDIIFPHAKGWDLKEGDAQKVEGLPDSTFDVVFSSHCLEHLADPVEAIKNWWRILKPGGYLIVIVPDEDCYEQGVFPSQWNNDHKFTYTISKDTSWCDRSINLADLLLELPHHKVWSLKIVDEGYDYTKTGVDQSLGPAEVGIEMIVQKMTPA
jgi:SAM-dependent methyltransferase